MELTVENIIKIIIGIVVVAAVTYALYAFFSGRVIDFFRNFGVNTTAKFLMALC